MGRLRRLIMPLSITYVFIISIILVSLLFLFPIDELSFLNGPYLFGIIYIILIYFYMKGASVNPDGTTENPILILMALILNLVIALILLIIYSAIYENYLLSIFDFIYFRIDGTIILTLLRFILPLLLIAIILMPIYAHYREEINRQKEIDKAYSHLMDNELGIMVLKLMKKDAIFLDRIWQLYYFRRTGFFSMGPASYKSGIYRLSRMNDLLGMDNLPDMNEWNKLLRLISNDLRSINYRKHDLDEEEINRWLSNNIKDAIDYFNASNEYGSRIQLVGTLKRILTFKDIPTSINEFDLYLVSILNIFAIIYPILGIIGFNYAIMNPSWYIYSPSAMIIFSILLLIAAKYRPLTVFDETRIGRELGDNFILSPVRHELSNKLVEGVSLSILFYSIGGTIYDYYGIMENLYNIIIVVIFSYEIINYIVDERASLVSLG